RGDLASLPTRRSSDLVLALPVFVLEMGSHMIPAMHHWVMTSLGMQASWYLQFALTTLVLLIPGRRFYLKGIPALLRAAPDMNSLDRKSTRLNSSHVKI